jgi:hypothetical protein
MANAAPTSASLAPVAAPSDAPKVWLEFLLTGGATLLLLPLARLVEAALGLDEAEFTVSFLAFYGAFVINDPHFSVTYLLFYKNFRQRAFGPAFSGWQRIRYWVSGVVVPALLSCWAVFALVHNSGFVLGLMLQAMFLLVGWHYVKQGFGVLTMLSARRGYRYGPRERAVVLLHCYSGWAYAWASPAGPSFEAVEKGLVYTQYGRPAWLATSLGVVFAASAVALFVMLVQASLRPGRMPPLVPLSGLLVTVWLWVVYSDIDPLLVYVIPALHSLQYLFFVWLLERNRAREKVGPPHFRSVPNEVGKVLVLALGLGWLLFRGAPDFFDETIGRTFDSPGGLGPTPYLVALTTIVNVHHYFMDFVIWRRDNREMALLMR